MELARLVQSSFLFENQCPLIQDTGCSANKIDDTIPWILLYASSGFMLFKQYVNVVQLVEASRLLAQGDAEMRERARLSKSD